MTYAQKLLHIKSALILVLSLTFYAPGCTPEASHKNAIPERVISMAPSITEILFELGLGEKLVGVTRYCDYPKAAAAISRVGGVMDPNYEEIVALKPGLVILLSSHHDAVQKLRKLGIKTLGIPHETITDIHRSIELIAATCGVPDKASVLINSINTRAEALQGSIKTRYRPRVMICIGRDTSTGAMSGIYIAGRGNFYDEIIKAAGGMNAYRDTTIAYPQLSAEGIIHINPDIIIDLSACMQNYPEKISDLARHWDRLRPVTAVQTGRVHCLSGTYSLRPGPRYVQFLEELARLLHPEVFKGDAFNE